MDTIKQLWQTLKANKPLFITVLVGLAVLVYIIWKNSQANQPPAAPTATGVPGLFEHHPQHGTIPSPVAPLPPILVQPPVLGGPAPGPPVVPIPGQPVPGPGPGDPRKPLIPYGQLPGGTQYVLGNHLSWQGQIWTIGPGSNGILWGVPGNVSIAQWQSTPIAVGQKQVLYGPPSAY